jgi:hypothetical protein
VTDLRTWPERLDAVEARLERIEARLVELEARQAHPGIWESIKEADKKAIQAIRQFWIETDPLSTRADCLGGPYEPAVSEFLRAGPLSDRKIDEQEGPAAP